MLTTPFHEMNLKAAAKMVELFGYYLPWEYSVGHEGEHLGTRQGVSLCVSIIWGTSYSKARMLSGVPSNGND